MITAIRRLDWGRAVSRHVDFSLTVRPLSLPAFSGYAVRRVGDPTNTATSAELAALHPRTVPSRRAAFVAGRSAAHAALAELDRDVGSILPGPMREPVWPEGILGSLSHAGEVAVAVAAPTDRTVGIGVDVEVARPAPELWDQVPRPAERRWLRAIPDPVRRERALMSLFSAKEAVYKAFFPRVGHYFGFSAAELTPVSFGFEARLVERLDACFPPDHTFQVHSSWAGNMVRSWVVLPG